VADTLSGNVRSFSPSRAAVVRTAVVLLAIATTAPTVHAQTSAAAASPTGEQALQRAKAAWDNGDFDLAPSLYESALTAGGLKRPDVIDAYVRIGAALAATGKTKPALVALRRAALLDPSFTVPLEAGKKAVALAQRARREQHRYGALAVNAQVSDEVEATAPFAVDVALAPSKNALVDSVTLEVRDSLAGRSFKHPAPPDARIHFEVPARMTLPDASLVVEVSAVDAHDNELLSFEKHIHVKHAVPAPPPPIIAALRPRTEGRTRTGSGGGFWNTAWPYVIGGAALAAGGAAVYFATRPTSDVYVEQARVELWR
jgi:hypothetical protein